MIAVADARRLMTATGNQPAMVVLGHGAPAVPDRALSQRANTSIMDPAGFPPPSHPARLALSPYRLHLQQRRAALKSP
jgi:hypothetical protein